ncbi:MAG: N-acetylmuramoyl-L-alanine amidase [Clostridia bacterium]|nr:N-acetylmuramoyl-L-alanine amidase [Clostridia bacterium]
MKRLFVLVMPRKLLLLGTFFVAFAALSLYSLGYYLSHTPANTFVDPMNGVIVVDPGHGGGDGGANREGILEKDLTLSISKKLMQALENKGYTVIMTRKEDISLDKLDDSSAGRHRRDLIARSHIINQSKAQLFLSIHVNSNADNSKADGSVVFYGDKIEQSKELALSIQRALNNIPVDGGSRTCHNPLKGRFHLLTHTDIPGVIIETAYISNSAERRLLTQDSFQNELALAIAEGTVNYLSGEKKNIQ